MRMQVWSWRRMKRVLGAVALGVLAVLILWRPQAVATGVSRGLSLCGGVVIPSLFVFLVLSGVCVRTGLATALGRRLARPMRFLFRIPGSGAAAWLISLVGGYPAGAAAIRELLDQGQLSVPQAKRLLRGCVNAGPAFIIGGVGAGMLGSPAKGAVLFLAHMLAAVATGLLCCRGEDGEETRIAKPAAAEPLPTALVGAVNNACRSMLYLCGFVVLCAALLSLMDAVGITAGLSALLCWLPARFGIRAEPVTCLLPGILEVSCGCVEAAGSGEAAPLLLGMILGWGGLSVHVQVAAITAGYPLIDRRFFNARGLQALLGGVFSAVLCRLIPVAQSTLAAGDGSGVQWYTTSVTAAAALLLLCGMWLLCVPVGKKG